MLSWFASRRLSIDFMILLAAQILIQAAMALTGIIIARTLELEQYAAYTLVVTGLNITAIITDWGMSQLIARDAATLNKASATNLWQQALKLRLALGLAGYLVFTGLAFKFEAIGNAGLIAVGGLALVPMAIAALTTALLNAQGVMRRGAGANSLGTLASTVFTLAVLFIWHNVTALLVANVLTTAFAAFLLWQTARRNLQNDTNKPIWLSSLKTNNRSYLSLLKTGSSFLGITIASIVFQYADIYLVSALIKPQELALYSAALRLMNLMTVVATVWGIAALPRFSRLYAEANSGNLLAGQEARQMARRWSLVLTGAGIGLALLLWPLSGLVVELLLGHKYADAATPLALLSWNAAAIFAGTVAVTRLTATRQQHKVAIVLIIGGLFNLGGCWLLVGGLGWGVNGAALAKALSGFVLAVGYIVSQKAEVRRQK